MGALNKGKAITASRYSFFCDFLTGITVFATRDNTVVPAIGSINYINSHRWEGGQARAQPQIFYGVISGMRAEEVFFLNKTETRPP